MQRDAAIRGVERLPALVGLDVESAARSHERGNVGDRVPEAVSGSLAHQLQCLIEVVRARRIDGDELDVGAVGQRRQEVGAERGLRGGIRLGERVGRKVAVDLQLPRQRGQDLRQFVVRGIGPADPGGGAQRRRGHRMSLRLRAGRSAQAVSRWPISVRAQFGAN